MVTESTAKSVFTETHDFYERGFKSNNKEYDLGAAPWYKTWFGGAQARNDDRNTAEQKIPKIRKDLRKTPMFCYPYYYGMMLLSGNADAGNCAELACVANYLADKKGVGTAGCHRCMGKHLL